MAEVFLVVSGGARTGTGSTGPAGGATRKTTPTIPSTQNFGLRALEFAKKYNPLGLLFGTDVAAAEIDFSRLPQELIHLVQKPLW